MERRTIISIVAVIVIIGSVVSLFFTMGKRLPTATVAPFIGVGQAMAEQTGKALDNRGRILVLQHDGNNRPNSLLAAQNQAFTKRLKELGTIEITATETITPEEQLPFVTISRAQFDATLRKHPGVDAVVSFVGLPPYDPQNPLTLPTPAPKIIVYLDMALPTKRYLADGVVTAIIGPQVGPLANVPDPKTPREWFEKYYQVFDATNLESMPN